MEAGTTLETPAGQEVRALGEAGWGWVLGQVRWDDGPWLPTHPGVMDPPPDRDGVHSGIAGLAYVLAEVRLARPWSDAERRLADGIVARLTARVAATDDVSWFDGLAGYADALRVLDADPPAIEAVSGRLAALAGPDGWPQHVLGPPRVAEGSPVNDLVLGSAGVLLAALRAGAHDLAETAADILLGRSEERAAGLTWRVVSREHHLDPAEGRVELPNLSHGAAGIAAALAVAGRELGRDDLVAAAQRGAEYVVSLRDPSYPGLVVPRLCPPPATLDPEVDPDPVTWSWCHGPAGTSLLFEALDRAGVAAVSGRPTRAWRRDCLTAVRASGIPERPRPGFWDNDGRCCGTAGVGEVLLDSWQRHGAEEDLAFVLVLAQALVDRAVTGPDGVCWRFVEHRADPSLLPPGTGWLQGTAGIAAHVLRLGRVLVDGRDAPAVDRLDNWWALPTSA